MCLIFIGDFVQRLLRSESKARLLLPPVSAGSTCSAASRCRGCGCSGSLRVVHLVRDLRRKGGRRMVREISAGRAEAALFLVILLVIVNLEFATHGRAGVRERRARRQHHVRPATRCGGASSR